MSSAPVAGEYGTELSFIGVPDGIPDGADAWSAGRMRSSAGQEPRASYDPLQRRSKRDLVQRIRALEPELDSERRQRAALAYDEQVVRAKLLRLETEIILLQAVRQ